MWLVFISVIKNPQMEGQVEEHIAYPCKEYNHGCSLGIQYW